MRCTRACGALPAFVLCSFNALAKLLRTYFDSTPLLSYLPNDPCPNPHLLVLELCKEVGHSFSGQGPELPAVCGSKDETHCW